eukprot:5004886-Ditylum_brightwellii.AAC.1
MAAYLKGIHHTLESWQSNCDVDGWQLTEVKLQAAIEDYGGATSLGEDKEAPEWVHPVPQMTADMEALQELTKGITPPRHTARKSTIKLDVYAFFDASAKEFGRTLQLTDTLKFKHRLWGEGFNEEAVEGNLHNAMLLLATDNFVVESVFFKGISSSKLLFGLVVRRKKADLTGGFELHVIHVAGTRMTMQGTNG